MLRYRPEFMASLMSQWTHEDGNSKDTERTRRYSFGETEGPITRGRQNIPQRPVRHAYTRPQGHRPGITPEKPVGPARPSTLPLKTPTLMVKPPPAYHFMCAMRVRDAAKILEGALRVYAGGVNRAQYGQISKSCCAWATRGLIVNV